MSIFLNGVETNTVMLNGVDTTGVWNGEVVWGVPPFYTLTLQTDGHGTLTANTLTGYPGDTITLTPTYNTYYRFNNYSNTGGSIAGNVFTFGDSDATAQANFKVNAFTATGGFEKGRNVSTALSANKTWNYNLRQYATRNASTGDIPASWYSTSNRWNPSNASAYKITLNPKMSFTASYDPVRGQEHKNKTTINCGTYTNSTITNTQTFTGGNASIGVKTSSFNYSKSFTSTTQGTCSISSRMNITNTLGYTNVGTRLGYIANRTSGTWTATGYAP